MRFTILIPTFNRADLLGQAISAALGQTYRDREVIVIDDGSTDDTQSVAANYGQAIRYFRKQNSGKSSALNLGIVESLGDVIVVLDDDDLFPPWTLARHAEALERDQTADFSYGRFVRFQGETLPPLSNLRDMEPVPAEDSRRLVIKLMEGNFLPNPVWAVRKRAQLKAGPYDEALNRSQDYDMILRLARSNEGAFIDDVVLYQRKHVSNRGPLSEQSYTYDTVDKWIKYDALIFRKIERDWDLSDFRTYAQQPASRSDEATALLQKGVILFERKVYDSAARVLAQYRHHIGARAPTGAELAIATGLLGCRYGIDELVSDAQCSGRVTQILRAGNWPGSIRRAFASQLRWRIRTALTLGDLRYAVGLARFGCRAFGMSATSVAMMARFKPDQRLQALWTDLYD